MTDEEILKIYEIQNRHSHLSALWAVYDTGRDHAAAELMAPSNDDPHDSIITPDEAP